MSEYEVVSAYETENMFIIASQLENNHKAKKVALKKYISCDGDLLTKEEIKNVLEEILP